jgi:hypothetical protein
MQFKRQIVEQSPLIERDHDLAIAEQRSKLGDMDCERRLSIPHSAVIPPPNRATSAIHDCLGTRRRVQIALRLRAFGGPENFELTDVPKPAIRPGMALIRVDATSVNQIDVRIRSGQVPIGPDLGLSLS